VRAAPIVAWVRGLYEVKREAAELDAEGRRRLRQERSVPLLAQIEDEGLALTKAVLPKSPLGDALRYLENPWTALGRFVEDGRLANRQQRRGEPAPSDRSGT
jgi:transposase